MLEQGAAQPHRGIYEHEVLTSQVNPCFSKRCALFNLSYDASQGTRCYADRSWGRACQRPTCARETLLLSTVTISTDPRLSRKAK